MKYCWDNLPAIRSAQKTPTSWRSGLGEEESEIVCFDTREDAVDYRYLWLRDRNKSVNHKQYDDDWVNKYYPIIEEEEEEEVPSSLAEFLEQIEKREALK